MGLQHDADWQDHERRIAYLSERIDTMSTVLQAIFTRITKLEGANDDGNHPIRRD